MMKNLESQELKLADKKKRFKEDSENFDREQEVKVCEIKCNIYTCLSQLFIGPSAKFSRHFWKPYYRLCMQESCGQNKGLCEAINGSEPGLNELIKGNKTFFVYNKNSFKLKMKQIRLSCIIMHIHV